MTQFPKPSARPGVAYGPGVRGKYQFRIRELHVAETYGPLLKAKRVGAVKLDLVLRGIALLPRDAGRRLPGLVLSEVSYQDLHDICLLPDRFSMTAPEDQIDDQQILKLKRNWIGRQLTVLEQQGALRREPGYGGRPRIIVLRDHGTGSFDDPDGSPGNSYVTISGPAIAKWLKFWGAPEVAAYLAAMIADRYARLRNPDVDRGGAIWFETLKWFSDPNGYRPKGHVRINFSPRTLQRGFNKLREDGLITWKHQSKRPHKSGRRFRSGRRNIYTNQFDRIDVEATEQTLATAELNPGGG
ncbi:MAG: hypothetical protein KTV45_15050 [Acidimicrobiia bacterium]|nr:hypothetical protein [Acidimicrobiia bacterium]